MANTPPRAPGELAMEQARKLWAEIGAHGLHSEACDYCEMRVEMIAAALLASHTHGQQVGLQQKLKFVGCKSPTDILVVGSFDLARDLLSIPNACHKHLVVVGEAKFKRGRALPVALTAQRAAEREEIAQKAVDRGNELFERENGDGGRALLAFAALLRHPTSPEEGR